MTSLWCMSHGALSLVRRVSPRVARGQSERVGSASTPTGLPVWREERREERKGGKCCEFLWMETWQRGRWWRRNPNSISSPPLISSVPILFCLFQTHCIFLLSPLLFIYCCLIHLLSCIYLINIDTVLWYGLMRAVHQPQRNWRSDVKMDHNSSTADLHETWRHTENHNSRVWWFCRLLSHRMIWLFFYSSNSMQKTKQKTKQNLLKNDVLVPAEVNWNIMCLNETQWWTGKN